LGADYDRNSALARRAIQAYNPNPDDLALVDRLMSAICQRDCAAPAIIIKIAAAERATQR
jgi:hypothetical protein